MGAKRAQTHAKRARELELRERRERKRAKKAEAAARRAADGDASSVHDDTTVHPRSEEQDESAGAFTSEATP